jgi:hypothetical protein
MDAALGELRRLWNMAGRPSTRGIARRAEKLGFHTTYTTVHAVLHKGQITRARWTTIEAITMGLGGSVQGIKALHLLGTPKAPTQAEAAELARALEGIADSLVALADILRRSSR